MPTFELQAVDSRCATAEELQAAGLTPDQYPSGWQIMAHQAKTVAALRFGDAPIIINTAMTGDGKTLAGRLPLFNDVRWRTFAMYPTNELANDQARSLKELVANWIPTIWRKQEDPLERVKVIDSKIIDDYLSAAEVNLSRADKLQGLLQFRDYIMTNPDIFHLVLSFAYRNYGAARDTTLNIVANRYQLFVFDEFHLFGVAQISAVMLSLLLLRRLRPPRFLFLSATPQEMLQNMAARVSVKTEEIKGEYQHGQAAEPSGYRRILQAATLHLYTERLEKWVKEQVDTLIQPFFAQHPTARGLIIANSVAAAHRVHDFLKPRWGDDVDINTGITPKAERGRNVKLLVATSTVDVGVDFKINFLVFESMDAASHLQRLGRLGRHTHNADGESFEGTFEAHALLPAWVVEGLQQQFADGAEINREDYKTTLTEHFQAPQTFAPYVHKWAGLPAGQLLHHLSKFEIKQQYEHVVEPLKQGCITLFGSSVKKYFALLQEEQKATLEAANSFRGGSSFTALQTDGKTGEVMAYNLVPLLLNAQLDAADLETLYQEAEQQGQFRRTLERNHPLAAYRRLGWLEKSRLLAIRLTVEVEEEHYGVVIEQHGFRFDVLGIPELQRLNDALEQRVLVALIVRDYPPDMLRRILRLGYQLEVLTFLQGSVTGSVVFGRDALLLDAVLYRYRSQSHQPFIL